MFLTGKGNYLAAVRCKSKLDSFEQVFVYHRGEILVKYSNINNNYIEIEERTKENIGIHIVEYSDCNNLMEDSPAKEMQMFLKRII
jgi:hypothetical protein